jgi:hypothetical protein
VLELDIMPHWGYALSLYKATTSSKQFTLLDYPEYTGSKLIQNARNCWVMTMNTVPYPTLSKMGAKCSSKMLLPL